MTVFVIDVWIFLLGLDVFIGCYLKRLLRIPISVRITIFQCSIRYITQKIGLTNNGHRSNIPETIGLLWTGEGMKKTIILFKIFAFERPMQMARN